MSINAQAYTFHCCFTSEAKLPGYLGSTLRGALGWALRKTSCALRRRQCADCLLREQCTYAWIFETERYSAGDERTVNARPHPFVLQPGENRESMQPGDSFSFSLLLLDRAIDLLPQIVYAVRLMGESGIGVNRRQGLGRFDIQKILAGDEVCCHASDNILHLPDHVEKIRLEQQPVSDISSVSIRMQTPLRLKHHNRLNLDLPFHVLVRACLRRLSALEDAYGGGEPDLDYRGLVAKAQQVKIQESQIRWQQLFRWSNRQQRKISLSGLGGSITYHGNLSEFIPVLRYCEQVNIGKQTVFGLGKIAIH